ncbi:GNAT family N-acetyltransferase [Georgenia faecalis]|uniref:GNAT family N-acetyltransferase n=1 Tax=Georgenia faecalis TaxID=2483799 RepID=A0ABV9D8Y1_9MICO|nr:GNAT family N-acetyltransferase [Georgenia faecalis]
MGGDPGRVALRRWTTADAGALHAALAQSPDLATQLGRTDLDDLGACADLIATRLGASSPTAHHLAVAVDGTAVGNVSLTHVETRHGTAWVSYWLAPAARGRGLAARGLATVARWALADLDVFRLELGHRVNNPASCRVATRAGFAAEGIERGKLRYGDQRFDVETHARLATDPAPPLALLPRV